MVGVRVEGGPGRERNRREGEGMDGWKGEGEGDGWKGEGGGGGGRRQSIVRIHPTNHSLSTRWNRVEKRNLPGQDGKDMGGMAAEERDGRGTGTGVPGRTGTEAMGGGIPCTSEKESTQVGGDLCHHGPRMDGMLCLLDLGTTPKTMAEEMARRNARGARSHHHPNTRRNHRDVHAGMCNHAPPCLPNQPKTRASAGIRALPHLHGCNGNRVRHMDLRMLQKGRTPARNCVDAGAPAGIPVGVLVLHAAIGCPPSTPEQNGSPTIPLQKSVKMHFNRASKMYLVRGWMDTSTRQYFSQRHGNRLLSLGVWNRQNDPVVKKLQPPSEHDNSCATAVGLTPFPTAHHARRTELRP